MNASRASVSVMATTRYVGFQGISDICNISPSTARSYRRFKYLPEPDVIIDAGTGSERPGWKEETIREWQAHRPALNQRPGSGRRQNRIDPKEHQ